MIYDSQSNSQSWAGLDKPMESISNSWYYWLIKKQLVNWYYYACSINWIKSKQMKHLFYLKSASTSKGDENFHVFTPNFNFFSKRNSSCFIKESSLKSNDIYNRFRMQTINILEYITRNQDYLTRKIHSNSSGTLTAQSQECGASHTPSYRLGNKSFCSGYLAGPKMWGIQLSPFSGLLPALHSGTQDALCEGTVPLRSKFTIGTLFPVYCEQCPVNLWSAAAAK